MPVHTSRAFDTVFAEVRRRLPHLRRKQYQLAHTLLTAPETFVFGSIRQVARDLGVNSLTVIRFSQALGFDGYQALQEAVREAYLAQAGLQGARPKSQPRAASDPAAAMLECQLENLQRAQRQFASDEFDGVCAVLASARRVVICADGAISPVATHLAELLQPLGIQVQAVHEAGTLVLAAHDLGPEDAMIALGNWLTFRKTVSALVLARNRGARTIAIVGSASSQLADIAEHVLVAPTHASPLMYSLAGPVLLVELIAARLAAGQTERLAAVYQRMHAAAFEGELFA
ncbi:MAG: MurR/RpiR family transcriptional regulator, partial [Chloroflexi bacterium]|nr:MurR/RpiR family transcriptional regulator [Chloroflexota bacterium]